LAQTPLQLVCPGPQLGQRALVQSPVPGVQALLQAPQWLLSVATERQVPLQLSWPGPQQAPPWQVVPEGQTLPQAPQWLLSMAVLRQTPPQRV